MPSLLVKSCSIAMVNVKYKFNKITTQIIQVVSTLNEHIIFPLILTMIKYWSFVYFSTSVIFMSQFKLPILTISLLAVDFQVYNGLLFKK